MEMFNITKESAAGERQGSGGTGTGEGTASPEGDKAFRFVIVMRMQL